MLKIKKRLTRICTVLKKTHSWLTLNVLTEYPFFFDTTNLERIIDEPLDLTKTYCCQELLLIYRGKQKQPTDTMLLSQIINVQ